jgi:hypothetical protein
MLATLSTLGYRVLIVARACRMTPHYSFELWDVNTPPRA